jgi:hypothetical protein
MRPASLWRQRGFLGLPAPRRSFYVGAADFDGSTNGLSRNSGSVGIANAKSGIAILWFRVDGGDGALQYFMQNETTGAGGIDIIRNASNKIQVTAWNVLNNVILDASSTNTYTAGAAWHCLALAWDLATGGSFRMNIDGTDEGVVATYTNDTIVHFDSTGRWYFGTREGGVFRFNGGLADIYVRIPAYLDFNTAANLAKLRTTSNKPAYMGRTGAKLTGTAPQLRFHLDKNEPAANFALNRGTGGNFTENGTLTYASSSPSA